ncbi:hypothetical protein PSY31_23880, partial [Shigella flexneri]|nr:hypothetical protein [Shigella flexneri]
SKQSLALILQFLHQYEACSGQLLNASKSSFILAPTASVSKQQAVQHWTGFKQSPLPFIYLGTPLYYGRKTGALFDALIL